MTTLTARGRFVVQMLPVGDTDSADGVALGRMSLSKTFEGDLLGSGQGQMLSALTPQPGSAAYVAIERFTGTLHGRQGSFVLQHSGTMHAGGRKLAITVVPGSGTGGLAGIEGVFELDLRDGEHYYTLDYSLPA